MSTAPCADCGFESGMTDETVAKGSSVRDRGEALCGSCSATRSRLVRAVASIPDSLRQIRANRMAHA